MAKKRLMVELDAKTKGFDQKLDRLDDKIEKLGDQAKKTNSKMGKMSKVASGVGKGIGGMAGIAKAGIGVVAGLAAAMGGAAAASAKYAKELKVASDLSGESVMSLQTMEYATNTVGVSLEQIGDMSKDTREKLAEMVNAGTGGFQDFADAMGYSREQAMNFAKIAKDMSGPEIMQEMVRQMENAGLSSSQMSQALEAVASDSTKLLPLLKDNGAAMKELREEYAQTGVLLDETDVEKLGEVGQNFDSLYKTFKGTVGKISVEYADEMNNIMSNTQKGLKIIGDEFASGAFTTRFNAFLDAFTSSWSTAVGENTMDVSKFSDDFMKIINEVAKFWYEFVLTLPIQLKKGVKMAQKFFFDAFAQIQYYIDTARAGLKLLGGDTDEASKAFEEAAKKRDKMLEGNPYQKEIDDLNKAKDAIIAKFEAEQKRADQQLNDYREKSEARLEIDKQEAEQRSEILSGTLQEDVGEGGDMTAGEADVAMDETSDESPEVKAEKEKNKKLREEAKDHLRMIGASTKDLEKYQDLQVAITEKGGKAQLAAAAAFFEDNKLIQAGLIVANTASAAMKAFEAHGGVPWGIPPAAASVALGVKQLQSLKSANKKGGGSIAGASASGGGAPRSNFVPETTGLDLTESTERTRQTIKVEFSTDSGDDLTDAIGGALNRAQKEGRIS